MKIWQKLELSNDCAVVERESGEVSVRYPACFVFPGAGDIEIHKGALPEEDGGSLDARKMLRRILQETHLTHAHGINFFVATYDDRDKLLPRTWCTNWLEDYISDEAKTFVSKTLLPLLDNNQPVTIITTSYGGLVAEQVQRALRAALKERRMSDDLIVHKMRSVTQISVSSSAINSPVRTDDSPHFTTFHVQFSNDNMLAHMRNIGLQNPEDYSQPFIPKKAGRNVLDIEFLKSGLAVMTGYAYPEYWRSSSQEMQYRVDAPGQPHALRYLLDRQARATPGMYRAFVNVLCASLYRATPEPGMPPEAVNLREAIVRNPSFCHDAQSKIERGYLETELGESAGESRSVDWARRVEGSSNRGRV